MSFFRWIFAAAAAFVVLLGADISAIINPVEPTPVEGRAYTDGELSVEPDEDMHLIVKPVDGGASIYAPREGEGGYRYGPTVFANADGSLDAWFASPGTGAEWDFFTYRHSPDGGRTWTREKIVLSPTPGSYDHFSVCDPGVVKLGGYYYIGYTSTIYAQGICNNIFVARGKNPDGPFEKWNGSGWGGDPMPIIWFDEDWRQWGAGEPSMIVMGGELYIYYTWRSTDASGAPVNETRLAVADASDGNWPATIRQRGTAIRYADGLCDSADVKYVEDCGKFVAISTSNRFSGSSSVSIYESNDGLGFEKTCDLRTNISVGCHNSGISSRPNGRVRLTDEHYIAYAYAPEGADWGQWPTRLHRAELSLSAEKFIQSADTPCLDGSDTVYCKYIIPTLTGLTTEYGVYESHFGSYDVKVKGIYAQGMIEQVPVLAVQFKDYDRNIISIVGGRFFPREVGQTWVTAEYRGFSTRFKVRVVEYGVPIDSDDPVPVQMRPMFPAYSLSLASREHKQIRAYTDFDDGTFYELCEASDGFAYSGYDADVISVDERGVITARAVGATRVSVTAGEFSFDVEVTVGE